MRRSVVLVVLLIACARASTARRPPEPSRNVLAAEEIERSNVGTLHEAIRLLRPHFFFSRGRTSLRTTNNQLPAVIVNSIPQSSLEASLRSIPARHVQFVRFLSAPEATTRFGTGYMAGAIEVVLK